MKATKVLKLYNNAFQLKADFETQRLKFEGCSKVTNVSATKRIEVGSTHYEFVHTGQLHKFANRKFNRVEILTSVDLDALKFVNDRLTLKAVQ